MPGIGDLLGHGTHSGGSRGGWHPGSPPPTPGCFFSNRERLERQYYCDRSCKWTGKGHKCQRDKKFLVGYFKKYGKVQIMKADELNGVTEYPKCPMFEG